MKQVIDYAQHDSICRLEQTCSSATSSETDQSLTYFSTNCNNLSAKYVWKINGSKLDVYTFDYKCATRLISSFDFAQIFNDAAISISSVVRLTDRFEVTSKFHHPYKLIVILALPNEHSYICLVDVRLNCVLNTIDFPAEVTCAEVIFSGDSIPDDIEEWPLEDELRCMNGALAVGCIGGLVYLIDLILDSYSQMPLIPKQMSLMTCNNVHVNLKSKRQMALYHNQVICICVNSDAKFKNKFMYRSHDGRPLASFCSPSIFVSALHFIPQLSLLCVGYSFGGFHLYNLATFKLECSCDYNNSLLPLIEFAFQVPENDPKNSTYIWALRGDSAKKSIVEEMQKCSTASMYLVCYENREYLESYGVWYRNFQMCSIRFEMQLSPDPYDKNSHFDAHSSLIDMFTVQQPSSLKLTGEELLSIDYNLLLISWRAQENRFGVTTNYYLMLFDLNQWYHAQMPNRFCVDEYDLCPFISIYTLNQVAKTLLPQPIQALYLANDSISKYTSGLFYKDIHSYPISLSFELTISSSTSICKVSYFGPQKRLLNQLMKKGSSALVDPDQMVTKCTQCGLISADQYQSMLIETSDEIATKRELLLNVALENNLINFLYDTIKEWSSGELVHAGCDLRHFLDWIWKKVCFIKATIDSLSKPLFDGSSGGLSKYDNSKLVCFEVDLGSLSSLLSKLQLNAPSLTQQSFDQLKARKNVIQLVRGYVKMIFLFVEFGLLPEQHQQQQLVAIENGSNPSTEATPASSFLYDNNKLAQFYSARRQKFLSAHPSACREENVLLIDIIISRMNDDLGTLWQQVNHSASSADNNQLQTVYPPPSIYSILRMFMFESVPLVYKESVLLYFLLDLCDSLSEQQLCIAQKINILISSLSITQGIRFFIHGLWFLDHQNYERAVHCFTHPMVSSSLVEFKQDLEMFNALIQRILQLFIADDQFKSALIFSQSCSHFMMDSLTNEALYIEILLLNGNLSGAIEFERQRRCDSNSVQSLQSMFFTCEKLNILNEVIRIPLDHFEESALVDYLLRSMHPDAKKLLILFFVLNNKLLEAIDIVKQFVHEFNLGQEDYQKIVQLIEAYSDIVPKSLVNLVEEIDKILLIEDEIRLAAYKSNEEEEDLLPALKIKPKQHNRKIISASRSIEKMLEVTECYGDQRFLIGTTSLTNPELNHSNTPSGRTTLRPLVYLSPSLSKMRSKVAKAKSKVVPKYSKDLLAILQTPDLKCGSNVDSRIDLLCNSSKKSILKPIVDENESDRISENSKLKVTFSTSKRLRSPCKATPQRRKPRVATSQSVDSNAINGQSDKTLRKKADTPIPMFERSSRLRSVRKILTTDTPTHRMQLRNKKT